MKPGKTNGEDSTQREKPGALSAEQLIELDAVNAATKRRLRLALAGAQSAGDAAKEVRWRQPGFGNVGR